MAMFISMPHSIPFLSIDMTILGSSFLVNKKSHEIPMFSGARLFSGESSASAQQRLAETLQAAQQRNRPSAASSPVELAAFHGFQFMDVYGGTLW